MAANAMDELELLRLAFGSEGRRFESVAEMNAQLAAIGMNWEWKGHLPDGLAVAWGVLSPATRAALALMGMKAESLNDQWRGEMVASQERD